MKSSTFFAYNEVFRYLRQVYGVYDAFDCQALDRVETFNYFCVKTGEFEAVDAAFRSWEALGIHRPNKPSSFAERKALHYRQLVINS